MLYCCVRATDGGAKRSSRPIRWLMAVPMRSLSLGMLRRALYPSCGRGRQERRPDGPQPVFDDFLAGFSTVCLNVVFGCFFSSASVTNRPSTALLLTFT